MKPNKSNKSTYIMFALLGLWLLLIFFLSTQPGPETATTSQGLARIIANYIYDIPDKYQIHDVDMKIRKIAHIVLFFVLGILLGLLCDQRKDSIKKILRRWYLGSYTFLLFCCFFDEWHKKFIRGRHNDLSEAVLNTVGGTIGIVIVYLIQKIKMRNKYKGENS